MQIRHKETGEIIFEVSGPPLAGRQLRGARLHHAALRGEGMTGADLRGADLCIADNTGAAEHKPVQLVKNVKDGFT